MRIMLDTNILISAIFFPSYQTRKLLQIASQYHRLILCDYVIDELRLVVERKFPAKKLRWSYSLWNYHLFLFIPQKISE